MSQKLPVDNSEWEKNTSTFDESLIKSYNDNIDKGYIFEVDTEFPKQLYDSHNDLSFLPKRIKIKKYQKRVCNLYNKEKNVVLLRTLKRMLYS